MTTPASALPLDWSAARDETIHHLQEMLRIDTVNPPGNELRLAQYLAGVLAADGIASEILESAPGRANLIARLPSTRAARPVLLMAHMDTVGVERDKWSVDPFAGEVQGGYVYGRGAIDDKGMLAVNLVTMLLLKRHVLDAGGTLARDVLFVASADEEAGGESGIGWLLDNRPELVDAELALNEGGRVRVIDGRPLYVAVQTAEKVSHRVTVTARGPGGHSSVPLAGNAIFRLGRALAAIGAWRDPIELLPTTRRFLAGLSDVWPDANERAAMRDVASGDDERMARGAAVLSRTPVLDAVLRAGISAVLIGGGVRSNVIPTEATATLDIRTLPGQRIDDVIARLTSLVADEHVAIAVAKRGEDAPASDLDSPMFAALAESARELNPALAVVPYLSTGGTDSARLRRCGMHAYGILPFPLDRDDEERMHGNDERVPVSAVEFGIRLMCGAMLQVARG